MKAPIGGKIVSLLFSSICMALALEAASAQTTNSPAEASLHWVREAGTAYVLKAVPPPPAPGSDADKADLQAVLNAQDTRTQAQVEEAKADQIFRIELLSPAIGPDFTAEHYPVTFAFLQRVQTEVDILNSQLQAEYPRRRPYQDHPEVKNLYAAEGSGYPGSQAAASRMITLMLGELFRDKSGGVLERDLSIAPSAVNAGVNYPTDVTAGRQLAHALMFVLQDNPAFEKDLAKAQAEIQYNSASGPTANPTAK